MSNYMRKEKMKAVFFIVGFIFIAMAALATPLSIGLGLYDWVRNDVEFKFALWFGFKCWAGMLASGLIVGFPCLAYGNS